MKVKLFLSILSIILLFSSCISTEVDVNGSLRGTVKDASTNKPIANCSVSLEKTSLSTKTTSDGTYSFDNVDMGNYCIRFSATNYQIFTDSVYVLSGQSTNKDVYINKIGCPTIITSPAKSISHNSAVLSASIIQNGGADIEECGFLWGETLSDLKIITVKDFSNSFEYTISNLNISTTYYYKAFARNSMGEGYGELVSFSTDGTNVGSVRTNAASEITGCTALLHADIISMPKTGVVSIGFYYGTEESNLLHKIKADNTGSSSFSYKIENLQDDTQYYYKAFVESAGGEAEGEILNFKSLQISKPIVSTVAASNIGETSAILNGRLTSTGNDPDTEYGFIYGTSTNSMDIKVKVGAGTSGTYSADIKNLNKLSSYYYRAYAINKRGTTYGEIKVFETPDFNGHEYVDLGLSSGIKWAKYNIGSTDEYTGGDFFAWASSLDSFIDIAHQKWGGTWTMPTKEDFEELYKNCKRKHTTQTVNGVTTHWSEYTGPNGNVLILPDTGYHAIIDNNIYYYNENRGYYWTSTPGDDVTGNPNKVQKAYMFETNTTNTHTPLYSINYKANIKAISK